MQVSSNSRTLKGLSIAVIVMSILGIVGALIGFIVCGFAASVSNEGADYVVSQLDESGINSDLSEAKEAIQSLSEEDVKIFNEFLKGCDVSQVNNLGTAIKNSDGKAINKAIVKMTKDGDLTKTERTELIDSLSNLSSDSAEVLGETLESVNKDELQELADTLDGNASELLNAVKSGTDVSVQNTEKDTMLDVVAVFLSAFLVLFATSFFGCIFSLIASILSLRNHTIPEKLKSAFVWAIVAAVVCFITGRIVSMILLIIMAVYNSKVRKQSVGANTTTGGQGQSPVPPQA